MGTKYIKVHTECDLIFADSDKDGMPDYFEEALGYDKLKDDAMTKESDGYVRIEKYINWLGAMHATAAGGKSLDFDLRTITRGFKDVSPTYSVSAAENGTVELAGDGYTARFAPKANFSGLASFKYTVKGNDNTEYTGRVEVLVEKSAGAGTDTSTVQPQPFYLQIHFVRITLLQGFALLNHPNKQNHGKQNIQTQQ